MAAGPHALELVGLGVATGLGTVVRYGAVGWVLLMLPTSGLSVVEEPGVKDGSI